MGRVLGVLLGAAVVVALLVSLLRPRDAIVVQSFENLPPETPPFANAVVYQKGFLQSSVEVTGRKPPSVKALQLFIRGASSQWILHESIPLRDREDKFTVYLPTAISGWEIKPPVIAAVLMAGGNMEGVDGGSRFASLPLVAAYSHTMLIKPYPPLPTLLNWRKRSAVKIDLKELSKTPKDSGSESLDLSRWRGGETLISGHSAYSGPVYILVQEEGNSWTVADVATPDPFTGEFQGWWHHGVGSGRVRIVAMTGSAAARYKKGEEISVLPESLPRTLTILVERE